MYGSLPVRRLCQTTGERQGLNGESLPPALAEAVNRYGRVDLLVNNAATNPYFGPTLGVTDSAFDKIFEVNVKGYLYAIREYAARAAGGAVVNVASYAGINAAPLMGPYGMSKAAVISMTRTLAVELAPVQIRVNAVAPGYIDTDMTRNLPEEARQAFLTQVSLKRPGTPAEVARVVTFLASDMASYVSGDVLRIDGCMAI